MRKFYVLRNFKIVATIHAPDHEAAERRAFELQVEEGWEFKEMAVREIIERNPYGRLRSVE
jgi:hypothetical protein